MRRQSEKRERNPSKRTDESDLDSKWLNECKNSASATFHAMHARSSPVAAAVGLLTTAGLGLGLGLEGLRACGRPLMMRDAGCGWQGSRKFSWDFA